MGKIKNIKQICCAEALCPGIMDDLHSESELYALTEQDEVFRYDCDKNAWRSMSMEILKEN